MAGLRFLRQQQSWSEILQQTYGTELWSNWGPSMVRKRRATELLCLKASLGKYMRGKKEG